VVISGGEGDRSGHRAFHQASGSGFRQVAARIAGIGCGEAAYGGLCGVIRAGGELEIDVGTIEQNQIGVNEGGDEAHFSVQGIAGNGLVFDALDVQGVFLVGGLVSSGQENSESIG